MLNPNITIAPMLDQWISTKGYATMDPKTQGGRGGYLNLDKESCIIFFFSHFTTLPTAMDYFYFILQFSGASECPKSKPYAFQARRWAEIS